MRAFVRGFGLALSGPLMLVPALRRRRAGRGPVSETGEGRAWKS